MDAETRRSFLSRSPEATRALGAALGRALAPGTLLALHGELGSGKTCLVQGLAEGLGVRDAVTSPTFALMQSYSGRVDLHHFDAYMEGRERALLLDGGLEWMHAGSVAAIEWADRVADVLPEPRLVVRLHHAGDELRRLEISVEGDEGAAVPAAPVAAGLAAIVRDLVAPPGVEELA